MDEFVDIFKSFSDPVRIRILNLLIQSEQCVCHIVDALKLPQSTISRHLNILKKAGIVKTRKDGIWHYYSLSDKHPETRALTELITLRSKAEEKLQDDLENLSCNCSTGSCSTSD